MVWHASILAFPDARVNGPSFPYTQKGIEAAVDEAAKTNPCVKVKSEA